jgi:hypothetical protein
MSCRCTDILDCQADISTIGDIQSSVGYAQSTESDITGSYTSISTYSNLSFLVDDMTRLMNKEKDMNKDILELVPNISSKCSNEISNLQSQLSSMQSEDQSYHEELARQEREREESESK